MPEENSMTKTHWLLANLRPVLECVRVAPLLSARARCFNRKRLADAKAVSPRRSLLRSEASEGNYHEGRRSVISNATATALQDAGARLAGAPELERVRPIWNGL